jgi:hypothetical protein
MYGQNNHPKYLQVVAFLVTVATLFSANMQALVTAQKVVPRDTQLVVRKAFVPGGTINLLENAGQASVRGKNDFDGNRLTNSKNFVITGITVNYGFAATDTFEGLVDYSTALPVALRNANLVITQDDGVIRKYSIARINESKSSDNRIHELTALCLLLEERTTSIKIEFGEGAVLDPGAGNSAYAEVILDGFETKIKS